jgi:hypothetical protein
MGKKGTKGKQVQAPQAALEHNYDTIPEIGSDDFYPRLHFAASAQLQAKKAARKKDDEPSGKKPSVTDKGRDRGAKHTTTDTFCIAMAPFTANRRSHDKVVPLSRQEGRTSKFGAKYNIQYLNDQAKRQGIEPLYNLCGMQV